jgi:glycosyltransferase involved in cell wall biosynthesis
VPAPLARDERDIDALVLALKDPALGRRVAERLAKDFEQVVLVEQPLPRDELLDRMGRARVAVHLPALIEGAYLPALESMALETIVVCPDCTGNRSFCRDGDTCFVPRRDARAIVRATRKALRAKPHELQPLLDSGRAMAASRSLAAERDRLLEVLARSDELWGASTTPT